MHRKYTHNIRTVRFTIYFHIDCYFFVWLYFFLNSDNLYVNFVSGIFEYVCFVYYIVNSFYKHIKNVRVICYCRICVHCVFLLIKILARLDPGKITNTKRNKTIFDFSIYMRRYYVRQRLYYIYFGPVTTRLPPIWHFASLCVLFARTTLQARATGLTCVWIRMGMNATAKCSLWREYAMYTRFFGFVCMSNDNEYACGNTSKCYSSPVVLMCCK